MGGCNFTNKFNRLRKSSSDSIDNVKEFDSFKKYMHVVRTAEEDLKSILRMVNETGRKTLVLLCGSAGDGKSHLLSYLKNVDDEKLLDGYKVHNDATESYAPDKTAIETLRAVLDGFTDENLDKPGQNIILAINLGVLSNFIESEYGNEYKKLYAYVEKNHILASKVNENKLDKTSPFQHISFSDYHMFLLDENGVNPEYIELIFEKIICDDECNPFCASYNVDCANCPLNSKCPVKRNFEYFLNPVVRKYIAQLLVKIVIRDKEILTTRELLNYIFDIVVGQEFDFSRLQKSSVNLSKYLKEYLNCIMPVTLFESTDITVLLNNTKKYDPLLVRDEEADALAIEYYVADDVSETVKEMMVNSPYVDILTDKKALEVINNDKTLKSQLFNVLVRTKAMLSETMTDWTYDNYVKDLYAYNSGKVEKLSVLYSDIEEAVTYWCGNESNGGVCIDDSHPGLSIYEDIKFEEYLDDMPSENQTDTLEKFIPYIIVKYQNTNGNPIRLDIDFSLYALIKKLKKGYVQTAEDRNNHADFISFISKILKSGTADKKVTIISNDGQKGILEKKFGKYKFKVVK